MLGGNLIAAVLQIREGIGAVFGGCRLGDIGLSLVVMDADPRPLGRMGLLKVGVIESNDTLNGVFILHILFFATER